ncbi:hypothetical protein KIN20_021934 [Parelaphostrongylus tenuis]|uniref:Uncharacterized protein n=1 Tax=Parelaphostrongylus tenuis TaxID=148309 RepID=A0AAD5MPJ4_PARTN|nr:hypothetical protein KIN20_021934 [Parelaphostrongylus tenuis]
MEKLFNLAEVIADNSVRNLLHRTTICVSTTMGGMLLSQAITVDAQHHTISRRNTILCVYGCGTTTLVKLLSTAYLPLTSGAN